MKKELKSAIVNFILDNAKEFQIHNVTIENFKEYVYNSKGEYLIGGADVREFIRKSIDLLIEDYSQKKLN